jgi:hypothetical protein
MTTLRDVERTGRKVAVENDSAALTAVTVATGGSLDPTRPEAPKSAVSLALTDVPMKSTESLVIPEDPMLSMYNQLEAAAREEACERQEALCCGSCCDLVRAVVIVDIIFIGLTILFVVFLSLDKNFDPNWIVDEFGSTLEYSLAYGGIPFALIGIFGAVRFYKWAVLITAIWYCIILIISAVFGAIGRSLISAFFSYPHIHLFVSVHRGKTTPENYGVTEKYCCCGGVETTCDDGCDY